MSSPGQKRGSCGHAMASFDGHAFCARCRDKKKGTDTRVESPTKDCKFCLLLTPEQKTQLATPSYKLKKEKRDAKKAELSSPSKDGTLVDPSAISVNGAVSDKVSVSSPLESVPEKKVKDKPSATKSKKTVEISTDKKMEELDKKWSDRFNRLEALLMSKSFPPTFSSAVKVTPTHSPPSTISKDTEPFFQPPSTERTGQDSDLTCHCKNLHLSALCPTSLLPSISRPASLLLTDPDRIHHKSALVLTPLLSSISRPASFHRTDTDLKLQSALVPMPLPPGISLPASLCLTDLILTDLSLQCLPTRAFLICTDKGRTVLLVAVLRPVVSSPTDHL